MKKFIFSADKHYIFDLDDTLGNTTKDLRGDPKRILDLTLVDGAMEFLRRHGKRRCVLLTAGKQEEQRAKIRVLGIRNCFRNIYIVPTPEKKVDFLREFVPSLGIDRRHVTIVGDRLDVEIRTGNELGCMTIRVQLKEGKHSSYLPLMSLHEVPHYTVRNFRELLSLFPT